VKGPVSFPAVGLDGVLAYKLGVLAIFGALVVAVALNSVVAAGIAFAGLVLSMRLQRRYEARRLHGIKRRRRRN
jgi:hypothetical protein